MTISSFLIRPPHSPDELTDHIKGYIEVAQSFSPDPLPKDTANRLLRRLITLPGYRQEQVHSAYRNDEHLGGYRIYERMLRVGAARLATGCIGGVYTRADARNQGVATALMHDAIAYAKVHEYPLLLLDGIPKFYHRYGYCDVYDLSTLELDRQAILALPESPYTVRRSQLSDATSLLALYERRLGLYTGSFERSIEQQTHWMQHFVNLPVLTRAMLPEWQARWQRSLADFSGDVSLMVGDEAFTLRIEGSDLQLLAAPSITANTLLLTPQAFTQVVFGSCPIGRVLQQREHSLPSDLATVLTILFPTGQTWIPTSDWF